MRLTLLAKEDQDQCERLVFRVLDVNHKDYQAAMDGFVAICNLADQARSFLADGADLGRPPTTPGAQEIFDAGVANNPSRDS